MEGYLAGLSAGVLFRATPGERREADYQRKLGRKISDAVTRRLRSGVRGQR
jgi:hypothetical protein